MNNNVHLCEVCDLLNCLFEVFIKGGISIAISILLEYRSHTQWHSLSKDENKLNCKN